MSDRPIPAPAPRRPRVAIISDARAFGGAEHYLVHLVAGLRGRVDFIALLSTDSPSEGQERLAAAGAEVVLVPGLRRRPAVKGARSTARALRSVRPDLVHVNMTDQRDGLAALVGARLARLPIVATLHVLLPRRSRLHELAAALILRLPHKVIAVSDAVGHYAQRAGTAVTVVWNAVPPPAFVADGRAQLSVGSSDLVIGGLGRLHPQKGWDIFCVAAREIRMQIPDAVLVVIGEGDERESLQRLSAAGDVRFVGYMPSASALLKAFDICVMPSRYEGLALVAIESLWAGVPAVAADIPGLAEVLGEAGQLVPPDDPNALASAIVSLARDPARRAAMSRTARARAKSMFSPARLVDETLRVYASVLPGRFSSRDSGVDLRRSPSELD